MADFTTCSPCLPPQSSGLVEYTNNMIKIQSAEFIEALQLLYPKVLLLVPLNLRSVTLGTHKLSLFEAITAHPMSWAPSFDSQWIKGEILQYCFYYRTIFSQYTLRR